MGVVTQSRTNGTFSRPRAATGARLRDLRGEAQGEGRSKLTLNGSMFTSSASSPRTLGDDRRRLPPARAAQKLAHRAASGGGNVRPRPRSGHLQGRGVEAASQARHSTTLTSRAQGRAATISVSLSVRRTSRTTSYPPLDRPPRPPRSCLAALLAMSSSGSACASWAKRLQALGRNTARGRPSGRRRVRRSGVPSVSSGSSSGLVIALLHRAFGPQLSCEQRRLAASRSRASRHRRPRRRRHPVSLSAPIESRLWSSVFALALAAVSSPEPRAALVLRGFVLRMR